MNIYNTKMKSIATILFIFLTITVFGQNIQNRIPFYALPYYNFDPLTITIGQYQKELVSNNISDIETIESNILKNINKTNVETLYFLSIRLFDLGKKDDAFYWFMTAQTRARIFANMLDKEKIGSIGSKAFELKQLFVSLNRLVGEYMNGYGFNDIEKGIEVYKKVKSEVKDIQSYKSVYPEISFLDDKNLETEKSKKERDLQEGITYITENKELIKKSRVENGIQDKY